MTRYHFVAAAALVLAVALPAPAGWWFGKHKKENPADRLGQLLATVKTDKDEDHRADAAKELRDFDAGQYKEIVPILVDVLQNDQSAAVRAEAVQTLGKLRPVSQEAGWALEDATHDGSIRVRLQARSALLSYRLAGYHSTPRPKDMSAPATQAKSGTIAPPPVVQTTQPSRTARTTSRTKGVVGESAPPPLAPPLTDLDPAPLPPALKTAPLPKGPRPVAPKSNDQGPELSPPPGS